MIGVVVHRRQANQRPPFLGRCETASFPRGRFVYPHPAQATPTVTPCEGYGGSRVAISQNRDATYAAEAGLHPAHLGATAPTPTPRGAPGADRNVAQRGVGSYARPPGSRWLPGVSLGRSHSPVSRCGRASLRSRWAPREAPTMVTETIAPLPSTSDQIVWQPGFGKTRPHKNQVAQCASHHSPSRFRTYPHCPTRPALLTPPPRSCDLRHNRNLGDTPTRRQAGTAAEPGATAPPARGPSPAHAGAVNVFSTRRSAPPSTTPLTRVPAPRDDLIPAHGVAAARHTRANRADGNHAPAMVATANHRGVQMAGRPRCGAADVTRRGAARGSSRAPPRPGPSGHE